MSHLTRLRTLLLLLSVAVLLSGLGRRASLGAGQEASPDEALLRAAVSQYFESFAKKDLDGLLKCWSVGAPDLAARKQELQQEFAANDGIEVRSLAIQLTIEGEKATAQVTVEMTANDVKTGGASNAFGQMNRTLRYAKDAGDWKITHEASAEEELAVVLIAAKTDQERNVLLLKNHELVNARLIGALKAAGDRAADYREELRIYSLGENLAEKIGDKHRTAEMLSGIAAMHRMLADYPKAIDVGRRSLAISEEIGGRPARADAAHQA